MAEEKQVPEELEKAGKVEMQSLEELGEVTGGKSGVQDVFYSTLKWALDTVQNSGKESEKKPKK